ncbi:exonuclease domain-containing protein [Desulfococcus sp.]|uniref:exonuclease domain-containing protein n=1 Tax=Desulfococcus sp. TaxID=2025834 RepID=UPI003593B15F
MQEFIAIDFETANPKRVSACALGYAKVRNCEIIETNGFLIKPVGGHAPFQSKIHGIKEEHTFDKPHFGELFPIIKEIFKYPLVAHSLFDKQVLNALSDHFDLGLSFEYIDSSAVAKDKLPNLKNCKLTTLVKHFGFPAFKHHDATEDSIACARIFLKLINDEREGPLKSISDEASEFKGIVMGILADDEVNYKEAYELLYWLEDHAEIAKKYKNLYMRTKEVLEDDHLDNVEAIEMKYILNNLLKNL